MDIERLELQTPAKVNLFLGVSPGTQEGYHQLNSVFHTVDLTDTLIFEPAPYFEVITEGMDIPQEQNIAYKAGLGFARVCGPKFCLSNGFIESEEGVFEPPFRITIIKNIPSGAGLGGGSSNAAAVLYGLAHIYDNVDKQGRLIYDLARSLGSDVSFFLQGGAALMEGRGDRVSAVLPAIDAPIVLLKPEESVSTPLAYKTFDTAPIIPPTPDQMVQALEDGNVAAVGAALYNNLAPAAMQIEPQVQAVYKALAKTSGVYGALVSGSGSTVFALCETDERAEEIAHIGRESGLWGYATRICESSICISDEQRRAPQSSRTARLWR